MPPAPGAQNSPSIEKERDRFLRSIAPETAFHRLFDHLPGISFFAKDRKFRIVSANRRFFERFGFTEEAQILGKDDFELFPPRLAENFRRDDGEVLRTGEPRLNIIELFFNRQGIPDWFITNKLPLKNRAGQVIGVMGTVQSYESKKAVLLPYLQIDRAVNWIRDHFREHISVEDLASMVGLSPRQLHRKFVETFGSSPQAFIIKLRIQAACEILQHQDKSISEAARETGFSDHSSFTQHFQKHIGLTPLHYQRQFRMVRSR
jgi:PAS domain S-box-containing protein